MSQLAHSFVCRFLGLSAVLGAAIAISGCAYTMGEFDRTTTAAMPTAADAPVASTLPVKPATYVVDTADVPAAVAGPAPATATAYPNINDVPNGPKSKLLSPDEKAKVIADLEALAKSQGAAVEKSRKQSAAQCGDAVKNALDPETKLKSEAAGQGC